MISLPPGPLPWPTLSRGDISDQFLIIHFEDSILAVGRPRCGRVHALYNLFFPYKGAHDIQFCPYLFTYTEVHVKFGALVVAASFCLMAA